jgi:hypothetical protein
MFGEPCALGYFDSRLGEGLYGTAQKAAGGHYLWKKRFAGIRIRRFKEADMTYHNPFPARAMTMGDISLLRQAVIVAAEKSERSADSVAPIVYDLYCRGLKDPEKLAEAAGLLATSRSF